MTFHVNTTRFDKALVGLSNHVNVSTKKFLENEARLLQGELAKQFTPKLEKKKKGIGIDRRLAYRVAKVGASSLPYQRLQRIINHQKPGGIRPVVQAAIAKPLERRAIKRIGVLAAGFIGRGNKLGATAKGFVMAHVTQCYGDVTTSWGLLTRWVRLRNWTPWLQDMRGKNFLVQRALNKRAGAMRTQTRLIATGVKKYWEAK